MNDEIKYSPKLKTAMQEIDEIMKKHDIGGLVVLHTPGFGEFKSYLSPSYSCVKLMPNGLGHRIQSKLENYGGDRPKQEKDLRDTANMLSVLAELSVGQTMHVIEMSERIDVALESIHTPGTSSSHQEQNN